jgi:hypothetical protein
MLIFPSLPFPTLFTVQYHTILCHIKRHPCNIVQNNYIPRHRNPPGAKAPGIPFCPLHPSLLIRLAGRGLLCCCSPLLLTPSVLVSLLLPSGTLPSFAGFLRTPARTSASRSFAPSASMRSSGVGSLNAGGRILLVVSDVKTSSSSSMPSTATSSSSSSAAASSVAPPRVLCFRGQRDGRTIC